MIGDVGDESFQHAHMFENLCNDAKKPMYVH